MSRRRVLVAPALLLALPLALLAPAAHAGREVTEDAVGDVQALGYDLAYVPAPQDASADIVRTVAALGDRRLGVTVHFRDLEVRPRHLVTVRVRTPQGGFDVSAQRLSASRPRVSLDARGGREVRCPGLRVAYDGASDEVALVVPASCIGSPRWVRLGVRAESTPEADGDNPSSFLLFADDAHRDAYRPGSLGAGPRVHRG